MKFEPINITLKNGASVLIREGKVEDAEEILLSMKEIFRDSEYLLISEDEFNMTVEQEIERIKAFENIPTSLFLTTTYNEKIIGNIGIVGNTMKKMKHTASMGISLRKEWQNIGLGRLLMEKGIEWAKEKTPVEILWLDVFSPNKFAIQLYEKLGFVEDGRQKNFCKLRGNKYCDKIIMSLRIK